MTKRQIKIDMSMLELAFEDGADEYTFFLDVNTGDIILLERDTGQAEAYEGNDHFAQIPRQDSRDSYADMQTFIDTVDDAAFCELLEVAIQGKGHFGVLRMSSPVGLWSRPAGSSSGTSACGNGSRTGSTAKGLKRCEALPCGSLLRDQIVELHEVMVMNQDPSKVPGRGGTLWEKELPEEMQ